MSNLIDGRAKSFKPTREHKRKRRTDPKILIDNSNQKKIKVQFEENGYQNYDDTNALVLPSSKRKTVVKKKKQCERLLSKKQKKKLSKVIELKEKKLQRKSLMDDLKEVQAKPGELSLLTSLQETQTLGRKVFSNPDYKHCEKVSHVEEGDHKQKIQKGNVFKNWNKISSGTKEKRKQKLLLEEKLKRKLNKEKYAVCSSSSSEECDSDEEMESSNEAEIIEKEELSCPDSNDLDENVKTNNTNSFTDDSSNANINDNSSVEPTTLDNIVNRSEGKDISVDKQVIHINESFSLVKEKKKVEEPPKRTVRMPVRDPKLQKCREKLPIFAEEHAVMEAINDNPVVLIVGSTGSGKTTQVPQFLYEAGFTSTGQLIGVTEPRRVAAIAMSERVAAELNISCNKVSYQVRFENNITKKTEIKFMTDGILLKELKVDKKLSRYSAVIIDEAHERNVQSDVLIGLLSVVVRQRQKTSNPLKLIIMSATLRVKDFVENKKLFPIPPPIINIDSTLFDVTIHYNRRTDPNYVFSAYEKVSKIHRQLPNGTILVFLTGQSEIYALMEMLREDFPSLEEYEANKIRSQKNIKNKKTKKTDSKQKNILPEVNLSDFMTAPDTVENFEPPAVNNEVENLADETGELEDEEEAFNVNKIFSRKNEMPLEIIPLYARLPTEEQKKVFEAPPEGSRLCVIATNVAETSLTIPNVKYVVDSGKLKQKVYDPVTGVSSFKIVWTSKASATQRAGRAGRVAKGHCYRLFSSAVHEDECPQYMEPEILRRPIDDVVLSLKAMGIKICLFPFPTPPDRNKLQTSIKRLIAMGALKNLKESQGTDGRSFNDDLIVTTPLGDKMSMFPVAPEYAKMLLLSCSFQGATDYIILIIAALTYPEVIEEVSLGNKKATRTHRQLEEIRWKWGGSGLLRNLGDILVLINAIKDADANGGSSKWCESHGVRQRDFFEIQKLRRQIAKLICDEFEGIEADINLNLVQLTNDLASKIGCIMLNCCYEFIAKRVDSSVIEDPIEKAKWKHAYKCMNVPDPVFISSLSVLRKSRPLFVSYQDIYKMPNESKTFLRCLSVVSENWLPVQVPQLCIFTPPIEKPSPSYQSDNDKIVCHRAATFGPDKWELMPCQVNYPKCQDLYKWAAYFFLTGQLCPILEKYQKFLYDPSTLIKPICVRYTEIRNKLVGAFRSKDISCLKDLEIVWNDHPNYLLKEYTAWFEDQTPCHDIVKVWPPLKDNGHMTTC